MTIPNASEPAPRKPLRLWPGVAALSLWLAWLAVPFVAPSQGGTAVLSGLVFGLVVILWWLFFSRARWAERLGRLVLMVVGGCHSRLVHASIADGMMGFMLPVYSFPILLPRPGRVGRGQPRDGDGAPARGDWSARSCCLRDDDAHQDQRPHRQRRFGPRVAMDADARGTTPCPRRRRACRRLRPPRKPPRNLLPPPAARRTGLRLGSGQRHRRRLLPQPRPKPSGPAFADPTRDGVVRGVRIETDWLDTPPVQLWRRPVGPGWSSFAVRGDCFYTQEQRGEDEIVACYNLKTGEPVWRHRDTARFWESNAGAGPRATPTLSNGRVYTLGATGILNALDARTGAVVWSRNAAADTGTKVPDWGFASSPLVVDDVVIVAAAGTLAAYDAATGEPRWVGPKSGSGYSSPHLATIDGVPQVLLLNGPGAISVAPADGAVLWKHAWPGDGIVQPALHR